MFVADTNWVTFEGNTITRATDIPTDTKTLAPMFTELRYNHNHGYSE